MGYIIGIILYLAIVWAFSEFGKFLKECDENISEMKREVKQ